MFGDIVRDHRRRLGMTQEELARATGISTRHIRDVEAGRTLRPRFATVRLLADAFGLAAEARDTFLTTAFAAEQETPGQETPSQQIAGQELAGQQIAGREAPGDEGASPGRPTPGQLPMDVSRFTGRTDELARLDRILVDADRQPTAVVVSAVWGTAGVGKTALAVHWAHRIRDRYPDGQLYINLRGFDPSGTIVTPAEAVRGFLDALGVAAQHVPADPEAQVALYRSLLTGKKMLVVLDNARDADQVRPLLPGAPGCLAIVTSRTQLTSLVAAEGAYPLPLDLLSPTEARELFIRCLGGNRPIVDPDVVDDIVASCAGLPLALTIVAARAVAQPTTSLDVIAGQLRDTNAGLDVLTAGDTVTDVRAVLSWSYRALTPDAARLFRLLGLHPGPDVSTPAAASLAGLTVSQVRPQLDELIHAHLLVEHATGRYSFHDLLRAYAGELARVHDAGEERRAAAHRVLDHYLHTAYAAATLLEPSRDPIELSPPQPGAFPVRPRDLAAALDWFTAEVTTLLGVFGLAATYGFDTHTWQLAATMSTFLARRGRWHDQEVIQQAALDAAWRLGDRPGQANAHRGLARAHLRLGRPNEALAELRKALDGYRESDHRSGQAGTHRSLSVVYAEQDRYREALHHAHQSLDLCRQIGHRSGQASALNVIGWYHLQLGDHRQGLDFCQQALALQQEIGDREGQADSLDSLAYAYYELGDYSRAAACYEQSIAMCRALGNYPQEADALTRLGDVHHSAGNTEEAHRAWLAALHVLERLENPSIARVWSRYPPRDRPVPRT